MPDTALPSAAGAAGKGREAETHLPKARTCAEGIAFAAEVKVILPGPQKGAAIKVPLDPSDHMLQHNAHLAGPEMSEA